MVSLPVSRVVVVCPPADPPTSFGSVVDEWKHNFYISFRYKFLQMFVDPVRKHLQHSSESRLTVQHQEERSVCRSDGSNWANIPLEKKHFNVMMFGRYVTCETLVEYIHELWGKKNAHNLCSRLTFEQCRKRAGLRGNPRDPERKGLSWGAFPS